jgi:hypothetical protein
MTSEIHRKLEAARLETHAQILEASPDYRVLRALNIKPTPEPPPCMFDDVRVLVVDVETTGLDATADKVIEFAARPIIVDYLGAIVHIGEAVAFLQDPGSPLPPDIVALTGLMLLPEDDILLRSGQSAPRPHASLQRASDAGADLGPPAPDLFKDRNSADSGRRLQDRHDLGVPHFGERIGPAPAARLLLLRWQARVAFDPEAGRWRKAGFGRSHIRAAGLSITHEQPHLVVGDMEAMQI